jgi:3-isopropylmalate/(R)-2-methylmalate dehydratase small subunit
MEPFSTHAGRALPLRRSNVDTDQIIPAEYLKRVSRVGFADGLFAAWRADPEFILNQPVADGATILVAGPDFGIGSSREHAVWALTDYGFRVVISARFGDIFRNNATKGGLLPARVTAEFAEELQDVIEKNPDAEVTVDLAGREVRVTGPGTGDVVLAGVFEIDDYTRWRLMGGLDDISLTLRYADEITSFEQQRPSWLPTADPVR